MKVKNYSDIAIGLKEGDALSAHEALKAIYGALQVAADRQEVGQTIRSYFENTKLLMQQLMGSLESGAILIISGADQLPRHVNPTQEIHEYCDRIFSEKSMDQHWQDKGKASCEDVAKNIEKSDKERAILERKAAAFDEIQKKIEEVFNKMDAIDDIGFDSGESMSKIMTYKTVYAISYLCVIWNIATKVRKNNAK